MNPTYCCEVEPENMPDFVAVVRCKDCKHRFDGEHMANCCEELMEMTGWLTEIPVDPNGFCSKGEREEGGEVNGKPILRNDS